MYMKCTSHRYVNDQCITSDTNRDRYEYVWCDRWYGDGDR